MKKKIWNEVLFKDYMKQEIAKGKTKKQRKRIEEKFCIALLMMDCRGLQGR